MIFVFRFPLDVLVVDLTTERTQFGKSTAYSSPTFITTQNTVARSSVTNTDGTKYRPWKAIFWCELNRSSSSERRWSKIGTVIVLLKYSEGLDAGMLTLWRWWSLILVIDGVVPTSLHILETVSNHLLWLESTFSLTCLRDVKVLISATARTMSLGSSWRLVVRPLRCCRHSLVITRALMNSVLVITSKRVLAWHLSPSQETTCENLQLKCSQNKQEWRSKVSWYDQERRSVQSILFCRDLWASTCSILAGCSV